jgi:hypothetical protein
VRRVRGLHLFCCVSLAAVTAVFVEASQGEAAIYSDTAWVLSRKQLLVEVGLSRSQLRAAALGWDKTLSPWAFLPSPSALTYQTRRRTQCQTRPPQITRFLRH